MQGRIRERVGVALPGAGAAVGRVFVVRRTALGFRVLARHSYGRVSRVEPGPGTPATAGGGFPSAEAVARAVAREVVRREPEPDAVAELARLFAGTGPRWELGEDDVRAALARTARAA